jgi:predicted nucleic-acid-binding protein
MTTQTLVAHVLLPLRTQMPLPIHTTMLELVTYLTSIAKNDREVVAQVTELVNGGVVVLSGSYAGRKLH